MRLVITMLDKRKEICIKNLSNKIKDIIRIMVSFNFILLLSQGVFAQEIVDTSLVFKNNLDAQVLELGKTIKRELAGGQFHFYQVRIDSGQYIEINVEQYGIDVIVTLIGPDGKQIVESDRPNGIQGTEFVSAVAETTGNYHVEIKSPNVNASSGRYGINVKDLRSARSSDKDCVSARKFVEEGLNLFAQGRRESLDSAIEKYEKAQPLMHAAGDSSSEGNIFHMLGMIYSKLGNRQEAINKYLKALSIEHAVKDTFGEAFISHSIGVEFFQSGDKQKALDYFNRALRMIQTTGQCRVEAEILKYIIVIQSELGENQEVLVCCARVLSLADSLGDSSLEGYTLLKICKTYVDMGKKNQALIYGRQALQIAKNLGESDLIVRVLNDVGAIYYSLGYKLKAREYLFEALPLIKKIDDQFLVLTVYDNLRSIPLQRKDKIEAINDLKNSISHWRNVADTLRQAWTLHAIGVFYKELGEKDSTWEYYNQAYALIRIKNDSHMEARLLLSIGSAHADQGNKRKAFDCYYRALSIVQRTKDYDLETEALHSLGVMYLDVGDKQGAINYYNRALGKVRENKNKLEEAGLLSGLGRIFSDLKEFQKALEHYDQARSISRTIGDSLEEAGAMNGIASVYLEQRKYKKALNYFDKSARIFEELGYRSNESRVLKNIGRVYSALGEKQKAIGYFDKAHQMSRISGDKRVEIGAQYEIALVQYSLGNLDSALYLMKMVLDSMESARTLVPSSDLRASYVAEYHDYYEFYIDLSMRLHYLGPQRGYDINALNTFERFKARSLGEMISESNLHVNRGADSNSSKRISALETRLNAKEQYRMSLLGREQAKQEVRELQEEIDSLSYLLKELQTQMWLTNPSHLALAPPPAGVTEIQQMLDDNTMLLEYALGANHSFLWAVTSTSVTSFELPKRAILEGMALRIYKYLTARTTKSPSDTSEGAFMERVAQADRAYLRNADSLSKMLLGPVVKQLGIKRLLIVPDGVLQYIPFGALPITHTANKLTKHKKPLILDHEIIILPSASVMKELRRRGKDRISPPKAVAVLADPVFSSQDTRVRGRDNNVAQKVNRQLSDTNEANIDESNIQRAIYGVSGRVKWPPTRLRFSGEEADSIETLAPIGMSMKALSFEANRETAMSDELRQYRILHFSTHGFINSAQPGLSMIVLSLVDNQGRPQNGILTLNDVYNLNLPIDVVVLSACETALGKEIRGEGLVGFTRGFMYAGASRVVASLWQVDDRASMELMKCFYQGIFKKGLKPTAALRAAQISMYQEKGFNGVYYWGGFLMQGEWE